MATLRHGKQPVTKPLEAFAFRAAGSYAPACEGLTRAYVVRNMMDACRSGCGKGFEALAKASLKRLGGEYGNGRWAYTRRHSVEVACFSYMMAAEAKAITGDSGTDPELCFVGGIVHDVGKTFLPMALVVKEYGTSLFFLRLFEGAPMNDIERQVLRHEHIAAGTRYARLFGGNGAIKNILDMVGLHHVMFNGLDSMVPSYPAHLKGSELPLHARIMKTADFISAVLPRHYKRERWVSEMEQAVAYAITTAGTELDPFTVQCFLTAMYRIAPANAARLVMHLRHPSGREGVSDMGKVREYVDGIVGKDPDFLTAAASNDREKLCHYADEMEDYSAGLGLPGLGTTIRQALRINTKADSTAHDTH